MEGKPGTITVSVTTLDASQSDRLSAGFNGQANKPAFDRTRWKAAGRACGSACSAARTIAA